MQIFDEVIIIYNPNSTGSSESNAKIFETELKQAMPEQHVTIKSTSYAGHAEEIVAEHVESGRNVLIVSSSGDGGYNEVINGVLRNDGSATVATAVLPSGNANDHARSLGSGDLIGNIAKGNVTEIEAIKVESMIDGKPWTRFAHSYVGFGLTPKVGRELTARSLNAFNEKWHTVYHMLKFKHINLTRDNEVRRYTSLVFSTITSMSKIIKLEENARKNDGKMEVYEMEYQTPLRLLRTLLQASLTGLTKNETTDHYEIRTVKRTLVQLDGEVFTIDAESGISVRCERHALRTIL